LKKSAQKTFAPGGAVPGVPLIATFGHYCPVKLKRFPRKALFSAAFRAKLAGVDFN
jgi:hypothetical protein